MTKNTGGGRRGEEGCYMAFVASWNTEERMKENMGKKEEGERRAVATFS